MGGQQCAKPSETSLRFTMRQEYLTLFISCICGPDSVVGIATGYGLGGPGIESRWGARFSALVQTGPGAHPASYTMGTGSFPGVKSGLRWAGYVARMGEERGCIWSWWGNRRKTDHWGDLGVDGWIILGRISRRWDVGIWTGLGWTRIETGGGRL